MAAQTIGKNTSSGTVTAVAATSPKLLYGTSQQAVLNSGQKLISCNVYWGSNGAFPSGNPVFEVALYDTNGGTEFTNAARIDASIATFNFSNVGRSAGWVTVSMDIDMSAHAGKTLCVGMGAPLSGQGFGIPLAVLSGASRKNAATQGNLAPATLAGSTVTSNQAWAVYFQTADIISFSLDSVTPNPVTNAGTLTAIINGNASVGTVSLIADGQTSAQTVSSWTYNAGTGTTTVISTVVQGGLPFGTVSAQYILGSGAGTLSQNITLSPIAGNQKVDIVAPQNGIGYLFYQLATGTYTDISQIEHTDSPNTVISPNGAISQTIIRNFSARALDGADDTWGSFANIDPNVPGEAFPFGVAASTQLGLALASAGAKANAGGSETDTSNGTVAATGVGNAIVNGLSVAISVGNINAVGDAVEAPPVKTKIHSIKVTSRKIFAKKIMAKKL